MRDWMCLCLCQGKTLAVSRQLRQHVVSNRQSPAGSSRTVIFNSHCRAVCQCQPHGRKGMALAWSHSSLLINVCVCTDKCVCMCTLSDNKMTSAISHSTFNYLCVVKCKDVQIDVPQFCMFTSIKLFCEVLCLYKCIYNTILAQSSIPERQGSKSRVKETNRSEKDAVRTRNELIEKSSE